MYWTAREVVYEGIGLEEKLYMNVLDWKRSCIWMYWTGREVYECIGLEEKLYMNILEWKRSCIWIYWSGREVVYEYIGVEEK